MPEISSPLKQELLNSIIQQQKKAMYKSMLRRVLPATHNVNALPISHNVNVLPISHNVNVEGTIQVALTNDGSLTDLLSLLWASRMPLVTG